MKKVFCTALLISSISSFASLNSKEFVNCFVKAVNETVAELKESGSKNEKLRICDELSQNTIDRYIEKFSVIEDGQIKYYSGSSMGQEKLIDLYDYMKDDMDCYGNKVKQTGSLFGAFANSASYHRNLNLTEAALNKMANIEMWDKAFSPSGYKTLAELDLSYCK